jgi:putative hydrolase of the HAD superfamily
MDPSSVLLALDYDGVLVDSYRGVIDFYMRDLKEMIGITREEAEFLLYMEFLSEGVGLMREDWWFKFIPRLTQELFDDLITRYWERRIERTVVLPGVVESLKKARREGVVIAHVGYRDDIYGLKRERLAYDGLIDLFDEVVVVGEDYPTRHDAIASLIDRYKPERVLYVDDKAQNLYVMRNHLPPNVELYKVSFSSLFDFPWRNPGRVFKEFKNIYEVVEYAVRKRDRARGQPLA